MSPATAFYSKQSDSVMKKSGVSLLKTTFLSESNQTNSVSVNQYCKSPQE